MIPRLTPAIWCLLLLHSVPMFLVPFSSSWSTSAIIPVATSSSSAKVAMNTIKGLSRATTETTTATATATAIDTPPIITTLNVQQHVLSTVRHDEKCFTQGLLFHHGFLYESCGLYGQSTVRKVDSETGLVLKETKVADKIFAEGLVAIEDKLYMLTWTNKVMLVLDIHEFHVIKVLSYQTHNGEGWGLTYDGTRLIASDGSSRISFFKVPILSTVVTGTNIGFDDQLKPTDTLEKTGHVVVKDPSTGKEVDRLNELEYVGDDHVWANIWYKDVIVKIDLKTGWIVEKLNLEPLYPKATREKSADCLNGIAYNATDKSLLLTGKLWPKYYKVKLSSEGVVARERQQNNRRLR